MSVTSAAAVANEFLDLADAEGRSIDPMKLQKLVFYAHAWWLALHGSPLFDEDVQAWPWGPVVREIYGEFRDFGRNSIVNRRATKMEKSGPGALSWNIQTPRVVDAGVKDFLRQIWDSHKHLSGIQLSNATHGPGEPWTIVKDQAGSLDGKPMIPNDLIREAFRAKMNVPA